MRVFAPELPACAANLGSSTVIRISSLQEDVCGQHTLETLAAARKEQSHAWETRKAQDPTW
eukprot:1197554-Rhodomonas_salina.1